MTWPVFDDEHVAAAERVIRSGKMNYWCGAEGESLEREYAKHLGRRRAIACANGTVALELAIRAFEIGAGDEVIVPARTFIGTAAAVVAAGATPVFCDVDKRTGCISPSEAARVVTERTRMVIAVHVGGYPVDVEALRALGDFRILEDCAQAHGGTYRGAPLGSFGDAAAFSFCQDKILSAGEGGLLALDDPRAYARAFAYKDHGYPTRTMWGSNYRMSEMTAAILRVSLSRLDAYHQQRTDHALGRARELEKQGFWAQTAEGHAYYRLYSFGGGGDAAATAAEAYLEDCVGWDSKRLPNAEYWARRQVAWSTVIGAPACEQ